MQDSELSAAAVRVLTGAVPVPAEQAAAVREVIWGRLGRTALGSSALARLHEQPGVGSAGIVESVVADELLADPAFGDQLRAALQPLSTPATYEPSPVITGPPTPVMPSGPAAPAFQGTADPAEVRKVWLLGLPQLLLCYVILYVLSAAGLNGWAGTLLFFLVSGGLAAYGLWCGAVLLRYARGPWLIAGTVLAGLVLLRMVAWLASLLIG
uniref:Uncharacterized protein n=1 Tax=Streptomyces sp. NBC_00008 TaxID=2903610 RepID=A0AAU2VNQ5_9ACTN